MFWPSRIEKMLAVEVEWLRLQLAKSQERIDRLTEAVARKNEIPIYMPQIVENRPLEASPGWYDNKPFSEPTSNGGLKK